MFKRLKAYFALYKAKKRLILLGQMIDSIDRAFIKKGISRKKRRQFWDDFVNSPENRKRFIEEMEDVRG